MRFVHTKTGFNSHSGQEGRCLNVDVGIDPGGLLDEANVNRRGRKNTLEAEGVSYSADCREQRQRVHAKNTLEVSPSPMNPQDLFKTEDEATYSFC